MDASDDDNCKDILPEELGLLKAAVGMQTFQDYTLGDSVFFFSPAVERFAATVQLFRSAKPTQGESLETHRVWERF